MSVAYFTTLNGLPFSRGSGCSWPGSRPRGRPCRSACTAPASIFAARQVCPRTSGIRLAAVSGFDEHAVVLAADFFQRVAKGCQEIFVGVQYLAVHAELDHRLRLVDRGELAGRRRRTSCFCAVMSVANFTTLNGLPLSRGSGCSWPRSTPRGHPCRSACTAPASIFAGAPDCPRTSGTSALAA